MKSKNRKREYSNNKFAGKAKEVVGKITGNEQLELKGKIQSSKAEIKNDLSVKAKIEDIKEAIAEKANDHIDKKRKQSK